MVCLVGIGDEITMGRLGTDKDVDDGERLSQHDPAYAKPEKFGQPVCGVSAHQLNLWSSGLDPGPAGFDWEDLRPEE